MGGIGNKEGRSDVNVNLIRKCVEKSVLKRFEGIIKDLLKNIAKSIA